MRVVLVRHGQTLWNREARFRGRADLPLDEVGLRQAEATGRYLKKHWPVSSVYASPLRRTMQTAEAIARVQGLTACPWDGLVDIHFGAFQGLSAGEAEQRHPDLYRAWIDAPHTVHFPGGESLEIVRERVVATLNELALRHADQAIALVSHTVVNRVLLCVVLGWGNDRFWHMEQDTCAVNVFEMNDNAFRIVLLNSTCHLE